MHGDSWKGLKSWTGVLGRGSAMLKLGSENVLARSCSGDHRAGLVSFGLGILAALAWVGCNYTEPYLYRAKSAGTFEQFRQGCRRVISCLLIAPFDAGFFWRWVRGGRRCRRECLQHGG